MEKLKINPASNMKGFEWGQFPLPDNFPHIVDFLVSPDKLLVGWVRTHKQTGLAQAVASPETLGRGDQVNLLTDGTWLGIYPQRIIAADTVLKYVKHTRT